MDLARMQCTPVKPGAPPLIRREILDLAGRVPGWSLTGGHLVRIFTFPDEATCFAFIAEIGTFARKEGHVPDLCLRQGKYVEVSFYTYPSGGLTLNDFIMAAKLNELGRD